MPRVALKSAADAGRTFPREFALLHQLGGTNKDVDTEALLKGADVYGDPAAVKGLLNGQDAIEFEQLAKAFAKPSQSGSVEGPDGNCLGWAARDSSGTLAPYKFSRRQLQPNDVMIKITHAGAGTGIHDLPLPGFLRHVLASQFA
eukprot:GHRQ01028897.1.p2 GENE.GHRQ01028897.1~~GHRQ01028897.1.p2  ORF type:complete len:145 (-),score=45.80 GHRQ01028897.1:99-533(-)